MSKNARNAAGCGTMTGGMDDAVVPGPASDHALTIDTVARMFKISKFALRLHELRGLIRRHPIGGERVYSWADCERITLLLKARDADVAIADLKPVIAAMDETASRVTADAGRLKSLALILALEARQNRIGTLLGELYRIDWELSDRLGVANSGGDDRTG